MRAARSTAGILAGLLVTAQLAACTVGPSERPAVLMQDSPGQQQDDETPEPAPLPPLGEPSPDIVPWRSCPEQVTERLSAAARKLTLDCAAVTSTSSPGGYGSRVTEVPMLRAAKAADGDERVPVVVIGDIDGPTGTELAAELAAQLPEDVLAKVSLVGFDRRGTGRADPIDCVPDEIRADLLSHDPADADTEPLLDAVTKAGQECSIALGNEQTAYDATHTASDLDKVRSSLGVGRLHAITRGEGTRVLMAYANHYPRRLGRVVLDGVPDPDPDTANTLDDVAQGAEKTLDAFAEDCASRDKCPLGDDPRAAVERTIAKLRDEQPIVGTAVVGPGLGLNGIWHGLRTPERWPELADAIDKARDGKVAGLAAFTNAMIEHTDGDTPPTVDATLATVCNDTESRKTPDQIGKLSTKWRDKYPTFGGLAAQRLLWCSKWPVRTDPTPSFDLTGIPPMLLISTAADPVTPEKGTTRAAGRLLGARLVAWQGAGHGAIGRSGCVDDNLASYLIDGEVPDDGVSCPA